MSNITIVLNDAEQQAFGQLLDTALRHSGAGALDVAYHFRQVLQGAVLAASRAVAPMSEAAQTECQPQVPAQT
jgi:hypothetical protein